MVRQLGRRDLMQGAPAHRADVYGSPRWGTENPRPGVFRSLLLRQEFALAERGLQSKDEALPRRLVNPAESARLGQDGERPGGHDRPFGLENELQTVDHLLDRRPRATRASHNERAG